MSSAHKVVKSLTVVGGMRSWSGLNYTYPLVRLTMNDLGVEIRWNFWFPGMQPIAARWPDVTGIGTVRPIIPIGRGVRISTLQGTLVFWTTRSKSIEIVAFSRDHGVSVDPEVRWV